MVAIKEVGFGTDKFDDPLVYDGIESLGRVLFHIFVMKPGTLPSLPNIGIDIKQYLYRLEGTINFDKLRQDIFTSCSELLKFMTVSDVIIKEMEIKKVHTLVVIVNVKIESGEYALVSAMKKGTNSDLLYSFVAKSLEIAS